MNEWLHSIAVTLIVGLLARAVFTRISFVAVLSVLRMKMRRRIYRIRAGRIVFEFALMCFTAYLFVRTTVEHGRFNLTRLGVTSFTINASAWWLLPPLAIGLVIAFLQAHEWGAEGEDVPKSDVLDGKSTALRFSLATPGQYFVRRRTAIDFLESESRAFFVWLLPSLVQSAVWEAGAIAALSHNTSPSDPYTWVGVAKEGVEGADDAVGDEIPDHDLPPIPSAFRRRRNVRWTFVQAIAACSIVAALIVGGIVLRPDSEISQMSFPRRGTVPTYTVRYGRTLASDALGAPMRGWVILRGRVGPRESDGTAVFSSRSWMASVSKIPERVGAIAVRFTVTKMSPGTSVGSACGASGRWAFDALYVNSSGRWGISRMRNNGSAPISFGSTSAKTLRLPFVFEGVCTKGHFLIRINHRVVGVGTDGSYSSGRVGVIARGRVGLRGAKITIVRSLLPLS